MTVLRNLVLSALTVAAVSSVQVPPRQVSGTVFLDRNGNGLRDAGEPGVANVVVSDQAQSVATGPDGGYRLNPLGGEGIVFVSVPRDHRTARSFWRKITEPVGEPVDFSLIPAPVADEFTFLHASDPHLSEVSAPRFRQVKEIVRERRPAFVLVSGDLVRDALRVAEAEARGYYDLYVRETTDFPAPIWSVLGNHEIFGIERHLSLVSPEHPAYGKKMYREYLGPNYYSFNYGRLHIIALDTVAFDDLRYYGQVDATQLAWLERDLSFVPPEATVVTFNHVPFFSAAETLSGYDETGVAPTLIRVNGKTVFRHTVSNAEEVLARLRKHRYDLALAGHIHAREKLQYETDGGRVRFYQTAAVVGPSTRSMTMISGVTLYRVRGNEIDDGEFIRLDKPASAPQH